MPKSKRRNYDPEFKRNAVLVKTHPALILKLQRVLGFPPIFFIGGVVNIFVMVEMRFPDREMKF